MQSGISASQELHDAFNELVSSSSQRGLLATIKNESLVPSSILALSSDFKSDLNSLQSHLTPTAALYILLKLDDDASDGYVAVTYVPDTAPVRQKMLFAATRLTLVRELGVERFRETIFATTAKELTPEGWEKHEKHTKLEAPLTEEEQGLKGIKDAEASEAGGTGARKSHVSSGIAMNMEQSAVQALEELKQAQEGALVMIRINIQNEELLLDSSTQGVEPSNLSASIPSSEPRYSFYRYPGQEGVVFMYSCPSNSKIKERMLYAACRARLVNIAEQDAGLQIIKRLEASSPDEWTESVLASEFEEKKVETKGFARPKRPGRR